MAVIPGGVSNTTLGTLRYPWPGASATKVTIPAELTYAIPSASSNPTPNGLPESYDVDDESIVSDVLDISAMLSMRDCGNVKATPTLPVYPKPALVTTTLDTALLTKLTEAAAPTPDVLSNVIDGGTVYPAPVLVRRTDANLPSMPAVNPVRKDAIPTAVVPPSGDDEIPIVGGISYFEPASDKVMLRAPDSDNDTVPVAVVAAPGPINESVWI